MTGVTVKHRKEGVPLCMYKVSKHDPMVHSMYRQNATTNPREKEGKAKTTLEKMYK